MQRIVERAVRRVICDDHQYKYTFGILNCCCRVELCMHGLVVCILLCFYLGVCNRLSPVYQSIMETSSSRASTGLKGVF